LEQQIFSLNNHVHDIRRKGPTQSTSAEVKSNLLPNQICHNSVFAFTAQTTPASQVCILTSTSTSLSRHNSLHTFLICTSLTQMPFRDSPSSDIKNSVVFCMSILPTSIRIQK
uniref:Uncharacterized protein n=1 Tax=Accipiter nisus TaxID=211598 RepID=A0A8B9RQG8_9AVES